MPPKAYASGSEVRTALPSGVDISGPFVQQGSVIVFGTRRSTDRGTTWSADPQLSDHTWLFAGSGQLVSYEMGRSGEPTWVARVYSIVPGTMATYSLPFFPDQVNSSWAIKTSTFGSYLAYNFLTGQSLQLSPPAGAEPDTRANLTASGGVLWIFGSLGIGHYAFAPTPTTAAGPWVTLSISGTITMTSTQLVYATTTVSGLEACSLLLPDLTSTPTCTQVAPSLASIGVVNLWDFGESLILGVNGTSFPYALSVYLWSGTSVTPIHAPPNHTITVPFIPWIAHGDTPYVLVQDATSPPLVTKVNPDASLAIGFAPPPRSAVPVSSLAIAPDRVVGVDGRNGVEGLAAWTRSVSSTGFGAETVVSHGGSAIVASAGRAAVRDTGGGLSIYDRGVLRSTASVSGDVELSGPYYRIDTYHPTGYTTSIRRVDGIDLGAFPTSGKLFGSDYISYTKDALTTGSYHAVITDLTGSKPAISLDLPPGTAACPIPAFSRDVVALTCGSTIQVYSLQSTALLASRTDPSLVLVYEVHDGHLMYRSGADYVIWDFVGDSAVTIPDPAHTPVLDEAGHVAYTSATELIWRDLSSFSRSAPRLLGIVAPTSVSFATPGARWSPEFDTTKALTAGQIVITADDGSVVRALATPSSADGSLRDIAWDGRDAYGRGVPVGTYSYRLAADATDRTGTVVSVDASGPAAGRVTVTAQAASLSAGAMVPLPPSRLLDTRTTGGKLHADESRSLQVTGQGGLPTSGVSAVVLNVTVTETTSGGYLTVSPTGTTRPVVSNLNWVAGATIPNAVTVKVGAGGKIDLFQSGPGTAQVIVDVAGYYVDGVVAAAGGFTSIAPARILDTRSIGGKLTADESRDLQITGTSDVPAGNVSAVVLNVTVTDTTSNGFLTVYPSNTPQPLASNLNWAAGATIPNLVTVMVGANGKVSLFQSGPGTAHVVVDVAGYYLGGTPTQPGMFVALTPARVLDTRNTGNVPGNGDVTLPILGKGGIPATGVSAVVVNTTVTDTTAAGYLTVYPGTSALPTASNLNWVAGTTIPNLVTVGTGADGTISFHNGSGGTTQIIADTAGYYLS
jgi:hypothetical protein